VRKLILTFLFLLFSSLAFAKFSSDEITGTTLVTTPTLTLSGTGTINGLDAIDATGETTLESTLDIAGDVDGTGLSSVDLDEASVESELEGVLDLQDLQGAVTDAQVPNTITITLAATATALAANGTNASSGNAILGVDASGNAEGAFDVATQVELDALSSVYQPLDADLTSIAGNTTGGFLTRTGANTYTPRTITGTANEVSVSNGDGVSGVPTISLPDDVTVTNLTVTTEVYDATGWNGDNTVPTKDALRDKIETLGGLSGWTDNGTTLSTTTDGDSVIIGGATSVGTSGTSVLAIENGTTPSTSPSDMVQLYSKDGTGTDVTTTTTTITASSETVGDADGAFNDDGATTMWQTSSGTQWIKADLVSNTLVAGYTIFMNADATQAPNTFTLEGSTNDSTWTSLDSQSGVTWATPVTKTYTIASPGSYRYYRLTITANNGGGFNIIHEMELLGAGTAELRVRDEAGNITTLSPHNFKDIPSAVKENVIEESEGLAWTYHSEKEGKSITVDMFSAIRELENLSGKQFIYSNANITNPTPISKIQSIQLEIDKLKQQDKVLDDKKLDKANV